MQAKNRIESFFISGNKAHSTLNQK